MPIKTSGSTGTEIPTGTQVSWRVREAAFDPNGRYGPTIELQLDITTDEYVGTSVKYFAKIAQERLDKAAKLRGEGVDDELIKAILHKQGYKFDELDDPDEMSVARGGALYAILTARQGDVASAEQFLKQSDSFDELAARLVGGRFVGTTGVSKDGYARLDAREDIFKDVAVAEEDAEEDFDSIPW
jgi:hypothetical protein